MIRASTRSVKQCLSLNCLFPPSVLRYQLICSFNFWAKFNMPLFYCIQDTRFVSLFRKLLFSLPSSFVKSVFNRKKISETMLLDKLTMRIDVSR